VVIENGTPSQQPAQAPDRDGGGTVAGDDASATAPEAAPHPTAAADPADTGTSVADRAPGAPEDAPAADAASPLPDTGTGTAVPAGAGEAKQRRKLKTVRDMLLSMAVITVGALFFYFVQPTDTGQDPVRAVDYAVEASTASRAAPYDLVVPEGLDEEWRATSVRYRQSSDHGAFWRIGFMDPTNEYVALGQADGPARAFVDDFTRGAQDTGETVTIDGRAWAVHTGGKYDALVAEEDDVTTVVTGTAGTARLEAFAATLAPHPNQ
jgi:hypothetical protein